MPGLRLPQIPWGKRWVVFAKPVARPSVVLDYLARYVHRTALSDKAITACDDRSVTFAYRDSQRKSMALHPHEFLRRFLQHVVDVTALDVMDSFVSRSLRSISERQSPWVTSREVVEVQAADRVGDHVRGAIV